jgi:hypothetical protein
MVELKVYGGVLGTVPLGYEKEILDVRSWRRNGGGVDITSSLRKKTVNFSWTAILPLLYPKILESLVLAPATSPIYVQS